MNRADRRIDGWKSIAAFFGRDRTTVARWARERNLPIHHIPGGKQKSVFAFEHELVAWAMRNAEGGSADALAPNPVEAPLAQPKRRPTRRWAVVALILTCLLVALVVYGGRATEPRTRSDAALMADYAAARDTWARRTPEDIRHAIQLYTQLIQRAPDFAPARAGLAEAWLIYREYANISDARAFAAARVAAQKAISLDPDLPSAHRALGFIDYWWDNDPVNAVIRFNRAIELDENDSQSHFWFANVLADLGEEDAAERHYARARLLSPGSQAIAVEHGCAQWQAGRDKLALKLMTELKRRYPQDATISNCLTWVYMGMGDSSAFAAEFANMAKIRNEPALIRLSRELSAATARDPATAHRVLIEDARREIAAGTRRLREVPAFYASSMGDRSELLALMREANLAGERWYSPSITGRIARRWKDDTEVAALLVQLQVAPPQIPQIL